LIKKLLVFYILFYIEAVFSIPPLHSEIHTIEINQDKAVVIFRDGFLYFRDFIGQGSFQIYSIIGNKIYEMDVQNFSQFQFNTSLETGNMYIIRVIIENKSKTFKIIAS
tara:strand:+ start:724 stop:1050 length:327 start_codon:yes stop_codon:yes gene_type:complete